MSGENIDRMRAYIRTMIIMSFDNDYLIRVCAGGLTLTELVDSIIFELMKYAYDSTQEKHSLRYYFHYDNTNDDDRKDRMVFARTIKMAQKYRDLEYERKKKYEDSKIDDLKPQNMDTIKQRKDGYRFTESNFYELKSMHEQPICKAIFERRIVDVKRISNKRFMELMDSYERWIDSLVDSSKNSNEDMVKSSLAFFNIEWKFCVELVYRIADYVEKNEIKNLNHDAYRVLCGDWNIDSECGCHVSTHSRMVKERIAMLPLLIKDELSLSEETKYRMSCFTEGLCVKTLIKKAIVSDEELHNYFLNSTSVNEWAAFLQEYNVFGSRDKKKYSPAKIRTMREIYDHILIKRDKESPQS